MIFLPATPLILFEKPGYHKYGGFHSTDSASRDDTCPPTRSHQLIGHQEDRQCDFPARITSVDPLKSLTGRTHLTTTRTPPSSKLRSHSANRGGHQTSVEDRPISTVNTSRSAPTLRLRCCPTNSHPRQPTVERLTTLMANVRISAPTHEHRSTEDRERQRSREENNTLMASTTVLPPPAELPPPPTNLPLPPTNLSLSTANALEEVRTGRVALNCRYRVPNTYLTVYHRQGRVMLCRPWEEPWLNGGNEGCGWL